MPWAISLGQNGFGDGSDGVKVHPPFARGDEMISARVGYRSSMVAGAKTLRNIVHIRYFR